MSARDDYPRLVGYKHIADREGLLAARKALDEIDDLRAVVTAAVAWRESWCESRPGSWDYSALELIAAIDAYKETP